MHTVTQAPRCQLLHFTLSLEGLTYTGSLGPIASTGSFGLIVLYCRAPKSIYGSGFIGCTLLQKS